MALAITAFSMMSDRLGSNAMRHYWRQSSGSVDLDHGARHRGSPAHRQRALSNRSPNAASWPASQSKSNRKKLIEHDRVLYRQRHKIENMFDRLKDWRRIHTRYDRCAHTFMSAICIAAVVIFWL